ncbi:MAG: TrkH family potassium uptake protein [Thermoplasmata archaeon]|nr:MAG: TrkH family potassium uptake protein [Thermoplasmata archaeon]
MRGEKYCEGTVMNWRAVSGNIGTILLIISPSFLIPIITGIIFHEEGITLLISYAVPMIIMILTGFALFQYGRYELERLRDIEAYFSVSLGWLIVAFFGSLPYVLSGTLPNLIDAYFESMSGFATCGATAIAPPSNGDYLDVYTHSIFMWRALTQWIGGIGIIVISVAILARILGGGVSLFKAEASMHAMAKVRPRVVEYARLLGVIYVFFTLLETLMLKIAGMNLYDALTHSFTTLATGGFGTHAKSIGYWDSVLIEVIVMVFILVGSISFVLHYRLLKGNLRAAIRDDELRLYAITLSVATIAITFNLWLNHVYSSFAEALRYASFQAISIHGTAGFTTADFSSWPVASQLILVILMLIGGCAGSTAGAIKVSRILVLLKIGAREIKKIVHPRGVMPIRIGDMIVPEEIVHKISAFFFAYIISFFVLSVMLTFTGLDIPTSLSAVATTMGGVGPGLGAVSATVATISPAAKVILSFSMWLGRLEIFTALMLFAPLWHRG